MDTASHSVSTALRLAIAGIEVCITCADSRLLARLHQRYHAFVVPPLDASPVLWLHIERTEQPVHSYTLDEPACFDHATGMFYSTNSSGQIDLERGQATLALAAESLIDIEMFLRVVYGLLAFRGGGLLFHGAALVYREQALLFFGPSGSGKTTVARLSQQRAVVLNDDLVLLLPHAQGWMAYATPFWNPSQVTPSPPRAAPLVALLRLVQAPAVAIEPMSEGHTLAELMTCIPVVPNYAAYSGPLFARALALLRAVPGYRLHFLPDDSFWGVVSPLVP
jgi:hypothetical protein